MEALKVFISYAREDEFYKDELIKHLSPLKNKGLIDDWSDEAILPGQQWDVQIKNNLNTADIILFLISPDFLASEYIHDVEKDIAIKRYESGKLSIVPIILRRCFFSDDFLSKFQALPKNAIPISKWEDKDEACYDVVSKLNLLFQDRSKRKEEQTSAPKTTPTPPTSQNLPDFKTLRTLIAGGKTKQAIKKLLDYTENSDDDAYNQILLLSSRFEAANKDNMMGILSSSDYRMAINRVNYSLLSILDDLEDS